MTHPHAPTFNVALALGRLGKKVRLFRSTSHPLCLHTPTLKIGVRGAALVCFYIAAGVFFSRTGITHDPKEASNCKYSTTSQEMRDVLNVHCLRRFCSCCEPDIKAREDNSVDIHIKDVLPAVKENFLQNLAIVTSSLRLAIDVSEKYWSQPAHFMAVQHATDAVIASMSCLKPVGSPYTAEDDKHLHQILIMIIKMNCLVKDDVMTMLRNMHYQGLLAEKCAAVERLACDYCNICRA